MTNHDQGPYPDHPHRRTTEAAWVALLFALIAACSYLAYWVEREPEITAYDRAMYQWCLERPRVVDGRCADVVAKMGGER